MVSHASPQMSVGVSGSVWICPAPRHRVISDSFTSPAMPHGTSNLPDQDKPTYEDYECCIQRKNLNEKLDFERDGIDLHLEELATVFEKWDEIAPLLGLTGIEVGDIVFTHKESGGQCYNIS